MRSHTSCPWMLQDNMCQENAFVKHICWLLWISCTDAHLSFLKKGLCCSQHCYQSSGTNKCVAHLQGVFPLVSSQLTKKPMLFKSKAGWQIHACAPLCSCLSLLLQSFLKNDSIIIYFLADTISTDAHFLPSALPSARKKKNNSCTPDGLKQDILSKMLEKLVDKQKNKLK